MKANNWQIEQHSHQTTHRWIKYFLQALTKCYLETIENVVSSGNVRPDPEIIIRLIIRQMFLWFLQEKGMVLAEGGAGVFPGSNEIYNMAKWQSLAQELGYIFKQYQFTVDENSLVEKRDTLTPELLGQVFEHLLAVYRSETGRTVRKRTGSFYTPRKIVDYMVDEALVAYFRPPSIPPARGEGILFSVPFAMGEDVLYRGDFEARLRRLLVCPDEPHLFNEGEVAGLIDAIDRIKILSPACGSGAFLMGLLRKLVYILRKLDPQNERWRAKQLERTGHISDDAVRVQVMADIARAFEAHGADYGRKLYLIQNNIYGVDIQPVAVEIASLRFFLALMIDWRRESGQPLPQPVMNLMAANILLEGEQPRQILAEQSLVRSRPFPWTQEFDLVIGNPPYVNVNEMKEMAGLYRRLYSAAYGSYDIYVLFFERAKALTRLNGLICFITSNKYLVADYGLKLRGFMLKELTLLKLLDLADCRGLFPGALVSPCITLVQNRRPLPGAEVEIAILRDNELKSLPDVRFERRAMERLSSADKQIFDIYLSDQRRRIVDKLVNGSLALGEIAEVRTGVMGFAYWSIKPFIYEGTIKGGVRVATNSFVDQYEFRWGKQVKLYGQDFWQPYLDVEHCPLSKSTKAFFRRSKIVIRGVAKRLLAQLDEEGVGLLVAMHGAAVKEPARFEPKYLLALLNSRLMNWYHRVKCYTARIPHGSLKYSVSFLKSIPIKQIPPVEQQPFVLLVDQILAAKWAMPGAEVSALEEGIDRLMYRVYGLTEEEIREVEATG